MTAIDRIKARLSAHPEIRYSEGPNEIDVKPPDSSGFSVGFRITPTGFTVNFEGWHEEFTSEDEALDCFAFGLSPNCRLAVVLRGNTETKWVVESLKDGKWTPDSETGYFFSPSGVRPELITARTICLAEANRAQIDSRGRLRATATGECWVHPNLRAPTRL